MTVTPASFVQDFPAFSDEARFPPTEIANIIDFAGIFCSSRRWQYAGVSATTGKTMADIGIELFTAHWCAMERRNQDEGANGAPPGAIIGPQSNRSIGPGSIAYDTTSGAIEAGGHWNLTNYGTRFLALAKMVGMAGIQVGIGITPPYTLGAWAGPAVWVPAWFGAI